MEKYQNGEALGEGEASKNDLPLWGGPSREIVQPTNGDASNASADSKSHVDQFLQTLKGQVNSINCESIDNKICKAVSNWAEKPTKEAKKFYEKGYTKYRYIGRKLGQAAVPYDRGLDYLKSKYPDEDPKHLEEEFQYGYGELDYDENFRKYFTKS